MNRTREPNYEDADVLLYIYMILFIQQQQCFVLYQVPVLIAPFRTAVTFRGHVLGTTINAWNWWGVIFAVTRNRDKPWLFSLGEKEKWGVRTSITKDR